MTDLKLFYEDVPGSTMRRRRQMRCPHCNSCAGWSCWRHSPAFQTWVSAGDSGLGQEGHALSELVASAVESYRRDRSHHIDTCRVCGEAVS